ncbi:MAG: hypothetical protein H0X41_14495 [Chitinophagaceae bacterium]|nr:hypothetical protein [Chitinophagaceae bacterium]
MKHPLALLSLLFGISSCESLKESSKYQFSEGYYRTHTGNTVQRLYLLTGTDTIKAYRPGDLAAAVADTAKIIRIAFPAQKPVNFQGMSFRRSGLDVDVLSVLFKYRPPGRAFPPQFNATFNGAVYLGYRTDVYTLDYRATPLHVFRRNITHYGYSAGVFTGLGSARIDEYVTRNALNYQYDGLVSLTGIAAIVALNKITAGLTIGEDYLLDKNHGAWLNNKKPWIGLSLGLNLN